MTAESGAASSLGCPVCPDLRRHRATFDAISKVRRIDSDLRRRRAVDAYIGALPDWQQAICREVRDLVHSVDQDVTETVKRPVSRTSCCRATSGVLATKDHVNVFLYDGGIVPDPEGIITAGHHNKTARTVAVHCGETIDASALATMFRQIIANNRVGGWRKLKRKP